MQYNPVIRELRDSRDTWIDELVRNPDSMQAAQHIVSINAKLELMLTMKYASGDYSEI